MTTQQILDAFDEFERVIATSPTGMLAGSDVADWLDWLLQICEGAADAQFVDCLRKKLPAPLTPENVGNWLRKRVWELRQRATVDPADYPVVIAAARTIIDCARIQIRENPVPTVPSAPTPGRRR